MSNKKQAYKNTVPGIRAMKAEKQKIAVLTAYDTTMAEMLD